ncbi:TlpA family protein disulfide reductase [Streptomyces sp. NPDC059076]|uniref:TlpA family protein disulfide reductase n=1 Tax=unclassified Streptomyces TaxID=2593676 RepID=UPI0036BAD7BB
MAFVIAGLVLVGALCLVNLLLLTGIRRKLRGRGGQPSGPKPGRPMPDFSATTLSGRTIGRADLLGRPAVLAFLSTTCPMCPTLVPHLVEHARSTGLTADRMVVVISGDDSAAEALAEPLAGVASVVVEPSPGELTGVFRVSTTPTTVLVDAAGKVARTETGPRPLADMERAGI